MCREGRAIRRVATHPNGERGYITKHLSVHLLAFLMERSTAVSRLNIPGYGLHKLSGNKKDYWSLKVSGNWRITFKHDGGHAVDVNLEDYH